MGHNLAMPPAAKKSDEDVMETGSPVTEPSAGEQSLATLKGVVLAPVTIAEQALQGAPEPCSTSGLGLWPSWGQSSGRSCDSWSPARG